MSIKPFIDPGNTRGRFYSEAVLRFALQISDLPQD